MDRDDDALDFEAFLRQAITSHAADEGLGLRVSTFEEDGVLTRDPGLVVRLGGRTFHVRVVRGR